MEKEREKSGINTAVGLSEILRRGTERRKNSPKILILDICVIAAAFLFVRTPLVFGAHPFSAALLAALPERVWFALLGTLLGAMSLGEGGIIYAMTSLIIVFLRIITSGAGKKGERGSVFGEGILLRMSVSVIGGFIASVYEILLSGMGLSSVLFGLVMIIAPPVLALAFSAALGSCVDPFELMLSDGAQRRISKMVGTFAYRTSILTLLFVLGFSMREYSALGISLGYLFSAAATLFVARRFGAVGGAAIGFVTAFAVSGTYSGAFMLAGVIAGAASGFGILYAVVFGGVGVALFSAYVGGVVGVSSTLPEYMAAAALVFPTLKRIKPIFRKNESDDTDRSAIDMVGTMALAYKSAGRKTVRSVSSFTSSVSSSLAAFLTVSPSYTELLNLVFGVIIRHVPSAEKDENVEIIATKLYKKEGINRKDLTYLNVSDDKIFSIFTDIKESYDSLVLSEPVQSDELRLVGKLVNEAAVSENAEYAMNEAVTDRVEGELAECGFSDFTVRVFGERKHHIILAGRDDDGTLITSPEVKSAIERAIDGAVGTPEYFRRGGMALMECSKTKKYAVSYASVGSVADGSEISGDVARRVQTDDDRFYALISDGMGSGEVARRSAEFTASYLASALFLSTPGDAMIHLLNSYLCRASEECSATVDLFSLDLYSREATFIKSGGANSYIKRGSSIFRIRSETAPLGIMPSVDSEKIRVQVEVGDYVIMMSDGVCAATEDAPWLLELISSKTPDSLSDFARSILSMAKRNHPKSDDMTVSVMRIEALF